MDKITLSIKLDTSSLDEAIEKVKTLKKELRELGLPYFTGNPLITNRPITEERESNP
ncbi:hypothetical protein [Leclercia adecarboxylata]|uniref:hypothetical protein n=1 Tax=Leclercia adecarboxylata TaxID=83655 RepID=UPI00254FBBD9|nr:hypothetical protein [Leclercia adecarboxylata]